ncbi:MAG TPA: tRNA glutamyl-Q(34) synthetase GluQRS [Ktedonobacterales bacterium]|nr:tRNA glutamyl-Q(34) synthetase GluQRS [Ktedonobacterales bacterium]
MSGQPVRGRYAPSPTGALHLGNLRTALLAWLFARTASGRFILRIEDLDLPRSRPGAAQAMLADLRWLGLDWDEGPDVGGLFGPYVQSMRQALYDEAIARLREEGLIYPCYCTRAELAQIASAPQGDEGPRYPGICRRLTARERAAREASGRRPALRFIAPESPIRFDDLLCGTVSESVAATVGDFIVRRSDGIVSYQLAVIVDDALMGITQVVRGADLLASTTRQLALYAALGYPRPHDYAHVPLMMDAEGVRLAKRDAATGLDALQAAGNTPGQVLASLAASCGLYPAETSTTPADLLAMFDPTRLNGDQTPTRLSDQAREIS